MGIGVNELRALAFGRRLGLLQLDQTVTLGRQQIFLSPSEYDQLVQISVLQRAEFPASDFAEPPSRAVPSCAALKRSSLWPVDLGRTGRD